MTSSAAAMEILCITNIGSNSSGRKIAVKMSDCNLFCANQQKCLKYTEKNSLFESKFTKTLRFNNAQAENWTENYAMKIT